MNQSGEENFELPLNNLAVGGEGTTQHQDDKLWDTANDILNFVDAYRPGPGNLQKTLTDEQVAILKQVEYESVLEVAFEKGMIPRPPLVANDNEERGPEQEQVVIH